MIKNLLIAIGICLAVAFAIYLIKPNAIGSLITTAHAGDYHCWDLDGCPRHRYRVRHHRVPERNYDRDRDYDPHDGQVRYWADPRVRLDPQDRGDKGAWQSTCKVPVRGLGTQWIGTEGALEAAKKDWMERVRYDFGEKFLDMSHTMGFESRCGRTSIGETAGQILYRCEIVARPCTSEMEEQAAPAQK